MQKYKCEILRFLGQGLITETNTKCWQNRRKIFQHSFKKIELKNLIYEFDLKTNKFIERLRTLSETNQFFDLKIELKHIALDIIADVIRFFSFDPQFYVIKIIFDWIQVVFGMDLDTINDKQNVFNFHIDRILQGLIESFQDPFLQVRFFSCYAENGLKMRVIICFFLFKFLIYSTIY